MAEPEAARESYSERAVGNVDQCGQPSPGLLAPCLGLALVAGSALWIPPAGNFGWSNAGCHCNG